MGWLSKLKAAAPVLGKVKGGISKGLQMFDKAKTMYQEVKNVAKVIPGAEAAIQAKEAQLKAGIAKKTGVNIGMNELNQVANVARDVNRIIPA